MTFKIILTILIAVGILTQIDTIDKERKPVTVGLWLASSIGDAIIIYGLWNWL